MTLTPTEARILRDDALIRVHVAHLRKKLPGRIQTVRGVGYRIEVAS